MKVIILAGGKGTRLAPYNTVFPKPLVPLGDRPILDIIIHQLAYFGFWDITISVGYLAELIEAYYANGAKNIKDIKIKFVREEIPLGTVGSLALVPNLNDSFLVINGDTLTDINYTDLIKFHKDNNALLTIALNKRNVKIDFGVVELNDNCELKSFIEKPTLQYLVGMGIYIYEPEVLQYIKPGEYLDFPNVVWQMLKDGKKVVGYPTDCYWLDLGSHADYQKAQNEFEGMREKLLIG